MTTSGTCRELPGAGRATGTAALLDVHGVGALRPRHRLLRRRRRGRPAAAATSSPRRRSARCSARWWPGPIDGWWRRLGEPDPSWSSRPAPAPAPSLGRCWRPTPDCAPALRYVLVEGSEPQRRRHGEHLPLDPAAFAFSPEDDDSPRAPAHRPGPIVVSLAELPRLAAPCVVLANELLDNLPFDLWERRTVAGRRCSSTPTSTRSSCRSTPRAGWPTSTRPRAAECRCRTPPAGGCSTPSPWPGPGDGGRLVVIDYAATTAELAARPPEAWLRTYAAHERGGPPLDGPGQPGRHGRRVPRPARRRRRRPRPRRTGSASTGSTSWCARAGESGRSGPTSATSRRCGCGAGHRGRGPAGPLRAGRLHRCDLVGTLSRHHRRSAAGSLRYAAGGVVPKEVHDGFPEARRRAHRHVLARARRLRHRRHRR